MSDQPRRAASKAIYAVVLAPFVIYLVAVIATRFGALGVLLLVAAVAGVWLARSILVTADMPDTVPMPRWVRPVVILAVLILLGLLAGGGFRVGR